MQLTFDPDVEAFRAEFAAFLDENLPDASETLERPRSVSHMPQWARRWQRLLFDNGWLLPGQPPEFGGRNATVVQQFVHLEELCRRRIYHSLNPQGVNIVAASLLSFGTEEQKHRWAVPILRAEITASLGMSEPSAGSDLASLRTRAVLDGEHFVVNGQKVWTSGAHDADVLLTFVRTNPDVPKAQGNQRITDPDRHPGHRAPAVPVDLLRRRPGLQRGVLHRRAGTGREPGRRGRPGLAGGQRIPRARAHDDVAGFRRSNGEPDRRFHPTTELERDQYATTIMDKQALRLLGSVALARAARGEDDVAAISVLKLLGSEAELRGFEHALHSAGADGLIHPGQTGPYAPMNLDHYFASWFERYARSFSGTIAGGTSEIQRNIIAQRVLGLPRG